MLKIAEGLQICKGFELNLYSQFVFTSDMCLNVLENVRKKLRVPQNDQVKNENYECLY